MKTFIIRRLLISIIVLFGVSIILYLIVRLLPNNYIDYIISNHAKITPEKIEQMKNVYGLNTGIVEGYFDWIVKVLKGDFGNSFLSGSPVVDNIKDKMWTSFWLAFISLFLVVLIAVPLGVIAATRQYSKVDYGITVFALIGISLPSFFIAIVLQQIFAVKLRILPLYGMVTARSHQFMSESEQFFDIAIHFILPIIVLTTVSLGGLMRYTRTNMLEVLKSDYIRTARAKGLSEKTVFYRHAFRNTLIPIVTILGGTLPALFTGAIITESIFALPGLGMAGLEAITVGDIPYIMAFNMFIAILTLLGTLLADITYAIVDPRVKLS